MTSLSVHTGGKSTRLTACVGAVLAVAPSVALAHPGHDGGFFLGLLHPLHGLDHLLAAVAVGMWAVRLGARALWALPLAFVAAMIAGGFLSDAGRALPGTEVAIALSVLVLGIAAASNVRLAAPIALPLVAALAVFHGTAHGAESPAKYGIDAYALGLVLATATLHTGGIGLGLWLKARAWVAQLAAASIAFAGAAMLIGRLS